MLPAKLTATVGRLFGVNQQQHSNQDMSLPGMNSCDVFQGSERLHKHYRLVTMTLQMIEKICIGF